MLKNHTRARSVGRPLTIPPTLKFTCESTLEKNPMSVNSVGKPSGGTVIFRDMNGPMVERNPLNVNNMLKPLHFLVIFCYMKNLYWRKKCCQCKQCWETLHFHDITLIRCKPYEVDTVMKSLDVLVIFSFIENTGESCVTMDIVVELLGITLDSDHSCWKETLWMEIVWPKGHTSHCSVVERISILTRSFYPTFAIPG